MAYKDFTLESAEATFGLVAQLGDLFPDLSPAPEPHWLPDLLHPGRRAAAGAAPTGAGRDDRGGEEGRHRSRAGPVSSPNGRGAAVQRACGAAAAPPIWLCHDRGGLAVPPAGRCRRGDRPEPTLP